jgi:hypothetical protein
VIWTILLVLILGWMFWAVFENGPTLAGVVLVVLVAWALIDYGNVY